MSSAFEGPGQSLCGCCSGLTPETPVRIDNRPGLSAVAYRVGTHARFKKSLIAGLSDSADDRKPLGKLQTRSDDDFTIALLDSFAVMADVLTFYQERIANEQYLRTAGERLSVQELARLIGYRLAPGVAAEARLAFTLDDAKGAPGAVTLQPGVKVQSVPGPGETPQTFETVEPLDARAEWNGLLARRTRSMIPQADDDEVYFDGLVTNLKVGDWILFVGRERERRYISNNWDFRQVVSVTPDTQHKVTHVRWDKGLGSPTSSPPKPAGMKAYALRMRVSLFGATAPDPRLLSAEVRSRFDVTVEKNPEWPDFNLRSLEGLTGTETLSAIHLDGSVPQAVPGSWILLVKPDASGNEYVELYNVVNAAPDSRNRFGLAGKTTRLTLEGQHLEYYNSQIRQTAVYVQSEQLKIAEAPIVDAVPAIADPDADVEPDRVTLDRLIDDPGVDRAVIFRGPRAHVVVTRVKGLRLNVLDDDGKRQAFKFRPGDVLELLEPPITAVKWAEIRAASLGGVATPNVTFAAPHRLYHLRNARGQEGYVVTSVASFANVAPPADAEIVSELVTVKECDVEDRIYSRLILNTPLTMVYDRAALVIFANVVKATHGETTAEVLGSGDSSVFQTFALKQKPLTHTLALTSETGAASTLRVTVNDLVWNEVDNFFGRGPRERVFITRDDDAGATTIEFGDGITGARPPTGQENIRATYRKGIGLIGQVKAEQLSLLLTRPLGVRGVINPLPAVNAEDPEVSAGAAANAPTTVLTLGRVVSLRDYEDFARSYVGIAKAHANWTFDHHARGVYVTVAGVGGNDVLDHSDLQTTLIQKLQLVGNPRVPIRIHGYRRAYFRLSARVKWDEANGYQQDLVFAQVRASLAASFAFAVRDFGQSVAMSEVVAVIQNVPGVVAVDVRELYRSDRNPGTDPETLLGAESPGDGSNADAVEPAELLMLDPAETPTLDPMP